MVDEESLLKELMSSDFGDTSFNNVRSNFNLMTEKTVNPQKLAALVDKVKRFEASLREGGTVKWFTEESGYPIESLPKHRAFFDAGAQYSERLAMAGNRTGKSIMGVYELTAHLTGEYPRWWAGRRFDHAIDAWAIGPDARTVRDTLQKELMGAVGEWGTGMIPAHLIGKWFALQGTPQAIDVVMIKHKSGGWSRLGFKNYQQDILSFMGTGRHVILCDEEVPIEIYNEANIRTATTKGIMICTFTPLQGLTPMVVNFCRKATFLLGAKPILSVADEDGDYAVGSSTSKAVLQIGWDDAPWLDEDTKARLLDDTPEHLREARRTGAPAMGSGNVYTTPIEQLTVDPFDIPDSWPRLYALDVGWNRTAGVWAALDPNTDTIYFYDEHYVGQELPSTHAASIRSKGDWIPGVIDPAARGRSQVDGKQLMQQYIELGLELRPARNDVEAGVSLVQQRLASGKLKVFRTCANWLKEYLIYRRDKNGKVVKEDDHAQDAGRYIVLNIQLASTKTEQTNFGAYNYAVTRYDV